MGKRLTGGYKIIPIGVDLALASESIEIAGLYASIKSTKKRIVLAGLKINGELQNDIAVKVDEDENGLKISDVYGYDLAISEEDALTVSEHAVPSGGTKLYDHTFSLSGAEFHFISKKSTAFSKSGNYDDFSDALKVYLVMPNTNLHVNYFITSLGSAPTSDQHSKILVTFDIPLGSTDPAVTGQLLDLDDLTNEVITEY